MKKYFLFPVLLLITSCLNPVLMRDPPNMNYELNKVEDIIISNSLMFLKIPLSTNIQNNEREVIFKLLVKNSNIKNSININLNEGKFYYFNHNLNAKCSFIPDNSSNIIPANTEYKMDCKVMLTANDVDRLGRSDLIGELRIPLEPKTGKHLSTNIYIRNEELK